MMLQMGDVKIPTITKFRDKLWKYLITMHGDATFYMMQKIYDRVNGTDIMILKEMFLILNEWDLHKH